METGSSIHLLHKDDSRLKLKVENRMRNVFVTQLDDASREEDENVNHIPVITETSSRILETGVNTLQRTLVLKKQVEMDEVDRQLALKRQEFKGRMQAVAQRKAELEQKQQATQERAKKFEKFVEDNEVKQRRALKKYQAARKQNDLRQREKEELTEQLEKLESRHTYLKNRVTEYKMYEDYLVRILDFLPEHYLDYGSESLVMPIIRRYETLYITYQDLVEGVGRLLDSLEQGQHQLEGQQQEHNTSKLMTNRDLSQLQSEWDRTREQNKQREMSLFLDQDQSRDQVEEVGSLLIAVRNLGQQCYIENYGPLADMDLLTMMDMVKEYILELADMEKRAARLVDCGSAVTSGTGSLRNSSKTQLKSISKISGKSGMSSR